MKRITSLALMLAVMFCFSVSCSGDGHADVTAPPADTSEDTTAEAAEVTTYRHVEDNLPKDLDLGGTKVTFWAEERYGVDLFTEELRSEPINDSVYNRELFVEERLNVMIERLKSSASFLDEVLKQSNSGDKIYDVFGHVSDQIADYVFDGYYLDLADVDYLDFEMPWWNKDFINECSIKGKIFMITGSLSLTMLRSVFAVYFNKTTAENYSGKIEELGDLYGLVDRGEWTIDRLMQLGGDIYEDLNGDQIRDEEDAYGITLYDEAADIPYGAFDISIFEKDEDDWFVFNVNIEKLIDAYEKIYKLFYDTPGCGRNAIYGDTSTGSVSADTMFASGNALFFIGMLKNVENSKFRNMSDDYGILPEPKYNEAQKEYLAHPNKITSFAISYINDDPGPAAAVLEAMASYSYNETVPAYLDLALKGRYMSDPQSRKMIDLTVANIRVEAAWTYLEEIAAGYAPVFRYRVWEGRTDFASTHQAYLSKIKRALMGYLDKFEKNFPD